MSIREEVYKNEQKGIWQGRFHDLHPKPNKFLIRKLATIDELAHLSVKKRRSVLRDLWLVKKETILTEQNNVSRKETVYIKTVIQAWLDTLKAKGGLNRTIADYATSMNYYLDAVGNHDIYGFHQTFEIRVLNYLSHNRKDATVSKHIECINRFWSWAKKKKYVDDEVILEPPVVTETPPRPYTKHHLSILEKEIRRLEHKNAMRTIVLMRETGMRPGEVWAMRLTWLIKDNEGDLWIHIQDDEKLFNAYGDKYRVKGRHEGFVPCSETLMHFISKDERSSDEVWWLDRGNGVQHWTRHDAFSRYFGRLCKKLGLEGHKPLHSIRSYVITELLGVDQSIDTVRDLARHSKFDTTLLYRNALNNKIAQKKKRAVNVLPKFDEEP